MRRLRVRCKVVLWFLILVMVFADLFMIFGKALVVSAADDNKSAPTANNRIRTNIQWAQKKTFSEMNASDIENLTYDDLRMIGVFLSNFYVPFKTKLGASSDEVSKQIQADMVKCLTDYCNFDKDTATPLAKAVMAMSLTDASAELKIGCVKRAKREGSSLSDVVTGDVLDFSSDRASMIPVFFKKLASENNNFIPATYARFMYMYSRVVSHNDYSSDRVFKTTHTDYDVCLFWEDGNKSKHIVMTGASFDNKSNGSPLKPKVQAADISSAQEQFHLEWSDFTPSSLAYALLNDESDYKNGFGNSVVSVPEADYKEMTADQKKLTLATNAKMYIDCFGNIFQDTGVAQEVVFPACVNPYVWYDASGDGTATTGNTINLINTFFIGEIERSEKCIQLSNPNGLTEDGRIKANGASTSGSSGSNVSLQDKAAAVQQGLENALNSSGNLSDFVASSKGILGRGNVNRKAAEAKESQSSEQEESKEGVSTPSVLPECTFKVYTGDYSLFNTYKWRTYQGRDSIEFTDGTITDDYKDSLGCADSDEIEEDKVSDVGKTGKTIMFPNWLTYLFAAKVKDGDEDELDEIADNVFFQDADEWQPLDNQKYQKVAHEDSSDGKNSFCDVIDVTSVGSDSKTVGSTKYSVPTFMDMIMIDNLGLFESSNPDDSDTLQSVTLFNRNGGMLNNGSILGGTGKSNKFGMSQADKSPTTVLDMGSAGKQYLVSIFLSYVFAYYDNSVGDARKIRWAFAKSNIPDCKAGALDFDDLEIDMNSQLQSELMSMAYYIMHPKEGLEFVKQWARNKISSIVVGWHEDMVGKSNGVSTTGSTRYIGFSGYVTMPNLRDLSWTDWLLNKYNSFVVYFIVLILVVMLGYVMVGSLSFQRAMVGVMIFGLCAYLPATVIDTTVNASNMLCDSMYSSKFTYWALAQHYQYQSQLNSAIESGNRYNYLSTIFQQQIADTSADYAVVALKWQCPKKENYMANVRKEIEAVSASPFIYKMATGIIGGQVSGETFLDSVDNLYLSRSYTDVANYSKSIADTAAELRNTDTSFYSTLLKRGSNDTGISGYLGITRDKSWNGYFNDYFSAMSAGFVHSLRGSKTSISNLEKTHINHIVLPLCSNPVKDALSKQLGYALGSFNGQSGQSRFDTDYLWDTNIFSGATIKKAGATDKKNDAKSFYVSDLSRILTSTVPGLSQQTLNMTLKTFNQISKQSPSEEYKNLQKSFEDLQSNNIGAETSYADKYSMMSTFAFTQYTESPYYYLSLNLRDQLDTLTELSKKTCDYKDLFLIKDSGYFFNTSWNLYAPANEDEFTDNGTDKSLLGYGEMRDYADMRSLFSVIIPYLKRCNDIVIAYDRAEGLEMFDDIEVTYDANYNLEVPLEIAELSAQEVRTSEIYRKYLHNVIVSQLLNIYCPWVDILYSCDYAQPEKISVAGETFKVEDPLDPSSYHDDKGNGRNMVFSRAEMAYYGLRDNDLTEVESRIIKMYDNLYEELLPLMDYYTFGNDVLNTGAAMLETFEFNKQFSQRDWFGEDYTLYPQNYELRNFSYDAFLRLILSGTTGDDIAINYEGGYYHHVIENSGIFTGILFILIDILAVYAIPALKLFFLILIFFLSVVVILCATVKLDMSLPSVLWKSLIGPLLKFFVVTVGFAFVVSLFMSDGNTAVTGRGGFVISLGSPAMTIIVMLVINILVLVLYAKIVKTVLLDAIKYTKAVASSFSGMIGGLAVAAVGIASAGKLSSLRSAGGTGGGSGAGGTGGAGGVGGSGAGGVGGSGTADARGVANTDIKNKGSSRQAVNNTKTTRRMAKANKKLTKSNEKATKAQNKYNKRIQDFLNKSNSGLSHGKPAGNSPEVTQERTQGASRAADRYSQQANSSGNTQSNSFNDKIQQRRKERLEKQQNFTQRNKMSGGANSAIQRSRKPKRVYSGKSKRASVGSHGKVKGKK